MNWLTRIQLIFSAKANAALDAVEDPRETLEHAYARQKDLLRQVKQGLVDVATARKQLEMQAEKLKARVPQLDDQAKRALALGREDLARLALQRKQTSLQELNSLELQLSEMAAEESRLMRSEQQLAGHVDRFRARREVLAARYTAAEAQVRIHESFNGLSSEFSELGLSLERAEDKIERMKARASALDALMADGTLNLPGGGDAVERELRDLSAAQAVEAELAALKAAL